MAATTKSSSGETTSTGDGIANVLGSAYRRYKRVLRCTDIHNTTHDNGHAFHRCNGQPFVESWHRALRSSRDWNDPELLLRRPTATFTAAWRERSPKPAVLLVGRRKRPIAFRSSHHRAERENSRDVGSITLLDLQGHHAKRRLGNVLVAAIFLSVTFSVISQVGKNRKRVCVRVCMHVCGISFSQSIYLTIYLYIYLPRYPQLTKRWSNSSRWYQIRIDSSNNRLSLGIS